MCTRGARNSVFAVCVVLFGIAFGACVADDNSGGGDDDPGPGPGPGPAGSCGDKTCQASESSMTCPADCPVVCGNKTCEMGETNASCPADCQPACNNKVCEAGEPTSCPQDCVVCGNKVCEAGETTTCPADCPSSLRIENHTGYTLYNVYGRHCDGGWSANQLNGYLSNGYYVTFTGITPGCWQFKASTYGDGSYWLTEASTLSPSTSYTWRVGN
jgi:hypothetical protein